MFRLGFSGGLAGKMGPLRTVGSLVQSQGSRRMASCSRSAGARRRGAGHANTALGWLGILGVSSLYVAAHPPVRNEGGYADPGAGHTGSLGADIYHDDTGPRFDGAFGGRLDYHEVALGSMAGLVIGYTLSRLSTVLFVVTIGVYLIGVYLRKQGIVIVDTKSMVRGAVNSVSWDELVFGQPSFSVPFVLSFFTSATL